MNKDTKQLSENYLAMPGGLWNPFSEEMHSEQEEEGYGALQAPPTSTNRQVPSDYQVALRPPEGSFPEGGMTRQQVQGDMNDWGINANFRDDPATGMRYLIPAGDVQGEIDRRNSPMVAADPGAAPIQPEIVPPTIPAPRTVFDRAGQTAQNPSEWSGDSNAHNIAMQAVDAGLNADDPELDEMLRDLTPEMRDRVMINFLRILLSTRANVT